MGRRNWRRSWFQSSTSRRPRTGSTARRSLQVEPLEPRLLLSVQSEWEYLAGGVSGPQQAASAAVPSDAAETPAADRWIVRFSEDLSPDARAQLVAAQHAHIVTELSLIDGAVVEADPSAAAWDVKESTVVETIWAGMPGVVYAEPDYVVHIQAVTPNDPSFSSLWGMNNTGQTGGVSDADIDAPEAWSISTGSSTVVVAAIDTGVDYNHADLAANIWTNPGEIAGDGLDNDHNGYIDDVHGIDACNHDSNPMDDHGHGTHTAGTIGAVGNNGVGVTGVNWNAKIMPLKFLNSQGSGLLSDAVTCLQYMTMMKTAYGVNVVASSNSWAGGGYSAALRDAIQASNEAGIMFVAAAGNNSFNNDVWPSYPASYDLPGIISVAAIDSSNNRANFSNYGLTSVDLGAPGVSILSTAPGNAYASMSGTSMATPHVAGAVALAAAYAGNLPLAQVKAAILDSADPVPALSARSVSGGRLNVKEMLERLGLYVESSTPASGDVLAAPPTDFTLRLTGPYDPATVAPGDLTVNGIAAESVAQIDAATLTFHYTTSPVTTQGLQTMAVAEGALERASDHDPMGEWSASFYYDAVPLQLAAMSPAQGSAVAPPLGSLRMDFNEPIDPTSVDTADLSLSQGDVTAVAAIDADTVEYTLGGVTEEGTLTITMASGTLRDGYGNPSPAFQGSLTLDHASEALPALTAVSPAGSMVYQQAVSRHITLADDTDCFTFPVEAGQTITVVVDPSSGLQPTVSLTAPGGVNAGPVTAGGPGQDAVLEAVPISTSGG